MNQQMTPANADAIVTDLHKRAFLGYLAQQHGIVANTTKEAEALVALGFDLYDGGHATAEVPSADAFGDGYYAQIKRANDHLSAAPGFDGLGKQAMTQEGVPALWADLPPRLIDVAYGAAQQLAADPAVYVAAVIKRACNEGQLETAIAAA